RRRRGRSPVVRSRGVPARTGHPAAEARARVPEIRGGDRIMASRAAGTYPPVPEPLAFPSVDTHTHLDICTGVRLPLGDGEPEPQVRPDEVAEFPSLDYFFDTAQSAGVQRIVQIGCDVPAARRTTELVASQYAGTSGVAEATAASAASAATVGSSE